MSLDGAVGGDARRASGACRPSTAWRRGRARAARAVAPRPRIVARSHAARGNDRRAAETIAAAARRSGVDHVSFLPLDASSDAFGGAAVRARRRWCRRPRRSSRFEAAVARARATGALATASCWSAPEKLRAPGAPPARERRRERRSSAPLRRALVVASWSRPTARCGPASSSPRSATRATGSRAVRRGPRYRDALARHPPAERRPASAASARSGAGGFLGSAPREAARSCSTTRAARATSCPSPSSTSGSDVAGPTRCVIVDGRARAGARGARRGARRATRSAWA